MGTIFSYISFVFILRKHPKITELRIAPGDSQTDIVSEDRSSERTRTFWSL